MNTERRQTQRQRLRIACEPCRERKRKCDGAQPCNMCVGYGYECSYRSTPRTRRRRRGASRSQTIETQEWSPLETVHTVSQQREHQQPDREVPEQLGQQQSQAGRPQAREDSPAFSDYVQSNSGLKFVRVLLKTLESNEYASPVRMLAWNLFLDQGQFTVDVQPDPITETLTQVMMEHFAAVYFKKFHPCYGFIEREMLFRTISNRWTGRVQSNAIDAMLYGVAAIGSLFSGTQGRDLDKSYAVLAKSLLDPSIAGPPSPQLSIAWLLRTVYLRLTARPEEAWLASCTTLHIIDAACSMSNDGLSSLSQAPEFQENSYYWNNVIGVAQHVNIWLSFDLGRRRVMTPNLVLKPTVEKPGEYTAELLGLLPYSEVLDPANNLSPDGLLTTLKEVLDRIHGQPPSVLAQCNLTLCIYRRVHSSSLQIPDSVRDKVFGLLNRSISAVHSAVDQQLPWHHVANIPFQVLSLLLVIDTAQSFSLLGEALACILTVNQCYQTEATQEAATAAYTLVELHRRRRETEICRHADMLDLYPSLDPRVQVEQYDLLQGNALEESWWFNHFTTHPDFSGATTGPF